MAQPKSAKPYQVMEYTFPPKEAARIVGATLEAGYNFRPPQSSSIRVYAASMASDAWRWTDPPPIRLSEDWSMCSDGVHRLAACALSGKPLHALVLVGEEWRADVNTDRGLQRTLAQFLQSEGYTHATVRAAVVRAFCARLYADAQEKSYEWGRRTVPEFWLIDYAKRYNSELDALIPATYAMRQAPWSLTAAMAVVLEAQLTDDEFGTEFLQTLTIPTDALPEAHPALAFRKSAQNRYNLTGSKLHPKLTCQSLTKLFNLIVEGGEVHRWGSQMPEGQEHPVGFPLEAHLLHDPSTLAFTDDGLNPVQPSE